jgi:hypothetical protein
MAKCFYLSHDRGVKTVKAKKNEKADEPEIRAVNPPLPEDLIARLAEYYAGIENILEEHAARLSPQDRRRLNGVGDATLGFIGEAFKLAITNRPILPHNIPFDKFDEDLERFSKLQSVLNKAKQSQVLLWNITLQAADAAYNDALSFYGSARMTARKKDALSVPVYKALFPFFKKTRRAGAPPTQKEVLSDANALLRGKKDGEVVIRNVKPKVIKGAHEVIDVKYEGGGKFKEEFTTNHTNQHEQR